MIIKMKRISVFVTRSAIVLICILNTHIARGTAANLPDEDLQRISDLEGQVGTLSNKITLMESNYVTLQNSVMEHLKSQALSNEFRVNQQLQFYVLSKLIKGQRSWLADMEGLVKEPTGPKNAAPSRSAAGATTLSSVAFSAFMDKDMDDPGSGQTVIFNKVLTNEGGAYNEHTGIFTCPKNGLYDFSFVIGQRDKQGAWVRLFVNSDVKVAAGADAEHPSQDIQGGNRVLVRLKKGDAVRVASQGDGHIEGDVNRFTTFSGVFVAP